MSFADLISPIEDLIEDARAGRMFILVDDEDRENEGDIIIPAQMATAEAINFMARHARGLICLALAREKVEQLQLPLMSQHNASRLQTAFTVSIEARDGVTTGISAADRARTVAAAIAPDAGPHDLVTPGHVFPLLARDGGVLVRTGHTEAAVDISRMAGLDPSGVICEVMNDDGTMARRDDLVAFAQLHGLKIGTIADLIAYRRRRERFVERRLESTLDSRFGGRFRAIVYVDRITGVEHLALIRGEIESGGPVLVRMHALDLFQDMLGAGNGERDGLLHLAMERIAAEGRGVVVLVREPTPDALSQRFKAGGATAETEPAPPSNAPASNAPLGELRDYGIGAQMLHDLGIREMVLLSNNKKTIVGLDGYGLAVVGQQPISLPEQKQ